MEIEIKEIAACKFLVNYQADAEQILNKRGEIINFFKKAPVPGFRTGKASVDALKVHYKDQIEASVKKGLAEDAFHNTLFEKKIKPHGAPKFNNASLVDGKFTCEFEILTKPEFTLTDYKGIKIPKPQEATTALEISEKILQDLRVRLGESIPFTETDFVQFGDSIILDYDGFVDGQKIETLSAVGEMLTIGHSQLQEFDNNLLGMIIGDTREFNMLVPENGLPSLQGKTVNFHVTLNMGSKNIPCPLDDQLAQKLGKSNFDELKIEVNGMAVAKAEENKRSALMFAISNKLIDDNIIDVPNWISLSEAQYLAHKSNVNWEASTDEDKERFLSLAEKNCKLSLILDKIREDEPEAQLSDQEVFDMIKANIAKSKSDKTPDEIIQEANKSGYLQILFQRIKDEFTLDMILKSAEIIE